MMSKVLSRSLSHLEPLAVFLIIVGGFRFFHARGLGDLLQPLL